MEIKETYEGITFTVEFAVGHPLRRSHKGKHWPPTTQCTIKRDGLVIGLGDVVKHDKEINNPYYGKIKAAKKAFKHAEVSIWREMRQRLWKQILVK